MRLYTAGSTIANREACQRLGVGLLIVDHWRDPSQYPYFAIDNGCYSAYARGKAWDPAPFMHNLHKARKLGLKPDFAVLPDIVAGGRASAEKSMAWLGVLRQEYPEVPFYMAVQDGMTPDDLPEGISGIFVGGSTAWKLETMREWAKTGHARNMPVHVGRIGAPDKMVLAHLAGIDSIDSTTWVQRNGALEHHIKEYRDRVGE